MNSRVALITFLDGGGGNYPDNALPGIPSGPVDPGFGVRPPVDPGYGRPGYGGGYPSHGLPSSPGHPSTGFPPNYPTTGPVFPPVGPDNTLPDTGVPPQATLPIYFPKPPSGETLPIEPDQKFELKYSFRFGWVLVPVGEEVAQPK